VGGQIGFNFISPEKVPPQQGSSQAGHRWLSPVILAPQEAEIRRITVGSQPRQIVHETLSQKKPITKKKKRLVEWSGSRYRP
jgi:hypothetical protein